MKNIITAIIPKGKNSKFQGFDSLRRNNIPLIVEEGSNPSRNRNIGFSKANSELIAFLNAHTIIADDWLENIIEFFNKHQEVDIVGGPQLTHKDESFIGRVTGYALSSIFGTASSSVRYGGKKLILDADEKSITSANLICRSKVLKKIRFDETLYPGEDPKFISDAKSAGFKVAYSPSIKVYNLRRDSLGKFARQNFNYGFVRPKKESLSKTIKHPSFLVPSIFIIYLTIFSLLYLVNPLFVYPIFFYAILTIYFSISEGIKNSDYNSILILPFIFFIIHVTYGLGFISGTIKKIMKGKI